MSLIFLTSKNQYIPLLDIFRGVAILIVLLYHIFDYCPLFRFGWLGVDLFFVLSGFLITNSLLNSREKPKYFLHFYLKRVLRIFPLYYSVIGIFFLFGNHVFSSKGENSAFLYYSIHQQWYWAFIQNWLHVRDGVPSMPYLVHLWSVAVEEQFYIIWPFAISFFGKKNQLGKLIATIFASSLLFRLIVATAEHSIFEHYYHNTLTRLDSLAAGSFLSLIQLNKINLPKWLPVSCILAWVVLILSVVIFYGNVHPASIVMRTFGYSITAVGFAALIYITINNDYLKSYTFSQHNPLILLGKVSYSAYLLHIPVFLISAKILSNLQVKIPFIIGIISLTLTLLLSLITYLIIEKPFLSLKRLLK
ncbi:acyltransferase family protein [Pseudocnuella soli]|uniref:acyltransferase family protein n=1 Tax=Pseudocnuella soli TaxID=2502779 RepID=UPI00104B4B79|nr:acyltransferase [Pseudocnuella soli]